MANCCTSGSDLSLLHMNIRSLSCHYDELVSTLVNLEVNFDVVAVSEIWYTFDNPIQVNVEMPGYKLFLSQSHSQNGGVGLYIKSCLAPVHRTDLSIDSNDFETVWVEIENKHGKNYLFCCVYRHPSSNLDQFSNYLQEILSNKAVVDKQLFILGDFNSDLLSYNTHAPTANFVNLLFSKQLLPYIVHPSRVSRNSATLKDNIFSNVCDQETVSGNILMQITEHFPQILIVKHGGITYKNLSYYQHDYSKLNAEKLQNDFLNLNIHYLNDDSLTVNAKFNSFLSSLDKLVNKHAPLKKLSKNDIKLRNKPWVNTRIQKMIRVRDRLFRRARRTNDESVKDLYKKIRNKVTSALKESKASYYYNYFQSNSNNMKQLWTGIKSIIDRRKSNVNVIAKIKNSNGDETSDPAVIANVFNKFFVNVSHTVTKSIPKSKKSPMCFMGKRINNSMFISPAVPLEISDIINLLRVGKSIGPNSIPIKILKILCPFISSPLCQLINDSFQCGLFPDKMKLAKVIPLFKKGCVATTSNYRPISLLSVFSKITEKVMYKRLYSFLEVHNVLYSLQFGFRASHSINHALISMTEKIKESLDSRRFGCGIFLDLQKAFDTVNHKILLDKLEHYGIRGSALDWFRSYLSDRKQYVSVNGFNSNLLNVTCGVPQGSVLGPLLFLIFINDLPNSSSKLCFYLFADDTNIYFEADKISKLENVVNKELGNVKQWLDTNRLSLNIEKTNFIIFRSQKHHPLTENINIKIGKQNIKQSQYVKFLGILLDENLGWKFHLSELAKKLARTCGMFFKIRHFLPVDVLLCLYNSLFASFLQYGIVVWGFAYDVHIQPIFLLQKRIIRAISFQSFTSPSSPIFSDLKILKLHELFQLKLLSFVYECTNKIAPVCFHTFFEPIKSIHQHDTGNASKNDIFLTHKNTLQYGIKSIHFTGAKYWNSIPSTIKQSVSLINFRYKLKQFLLAKSIEN